MPDPSPYGALAPLTGIAIAVATASFTAAKRPVLRAAALVSIALLVSSLPIQVRAAQSWGRSGQPTPAPVESVRPPAAACPPGMLGPQWLDQRWVCIPYDQAG